MEPLGIIMPGIVAFSRFHPIVSLNRLTMGWLSLHEKQILSTGSRVILESIYSVVPIFQTPHVPQCLGL